MERALYKNTGLRSYSRPISDKIWLVTQINSQLKLRRGGDPRGTFGLLIFLRVKRIKYGLSIYIALWKNYDSEKVFFMTLVETSQKTSVSLMTLSKTFRKTAFLSPMTLFHCDYPFNVSNDFSHSSNY